MIKRKELFLLVFLILLLFAINYKFFNSKVIEFAEDSDVAIVKRVIDGDTIVVGNDTHVRLLGVNTPEKGERYFSEAKAFLEMVALNKTVKLKYGKEREDLYGRTLAYVFIGDANVNKELVDEGYANFYFPSGKDAYYASFVKTWQHCLVNNKYLCEVSDSECALCIQLKELNVKSQKVVFYNNCSFSCNLSSWSVKDEGRKKFVFNGYILNSNKQVSIVVGNKTNTESVLYWKNEGYVWTSSGDTLFFRDEEGKLVLWKNY